MGIGLETVTRREFIIMGGVTGLAALLPACKDSGKEEAALEAEYQKGLQLFEQAQKLDVSFFTPVVEKFPKSAKAHFLMGNIYLVSTVPDNYKKAVEEYDKTIALDPNFAPAYLNKGSAVWHVATSVMKIDDAILMPASLEKAGEKAIKEYDQAIRLEPKLFSAHFNKGVVSKHVGRLMNSAVSLTTAINIGYEQGPYELTVEGEGKTQCFGGGEPIFVMSSFYRKAIDRFFSFEIDGEKVVELSPYMTFISNKNDPLAFAHYHRGSAYGNAEIRSYDSALNDLNRAIELNPNVPQFYLIKSLVHQQIGEAESAIRTIAQEYDLRSKIRGLISKQRN